MWSKTKIKNSLKKLNENWNDGYWIYVAGGTVHLMEKKEGQRVMREDFGVDNKYSLETFTNIDADGGDW